MVTTKQRIVDIVQKLPGDWRGPPADLALLSDTLGVAEVREQSISVDAMSFPGSRGYQIILNSDTISTRRRFSWAHELGHLITGGRERRSVDYRRHADNEVERLCDDIAAEILMPAESFRREMGRRIRSLSTVVQLSALHDTSITATAVRYTKLSSQPSMLVRWYPSKKFGGALRPSWQICNEGQGLRAQIPPQRGNPEQLVFSGAKQAWTDGGKHCTYEPVLVSARSRNGNQVRFPRCKVESVAFGRGPRGFVLSMVHLNDQRK